MVSSKNILIITYYFPPDPSIGSRRWVKFAKHLMRNGHQVYVLAKSSPNNINSPWDDDAKYLNVFHYESNYPSVLDTQPKSFLDKIRYKLSLRKIRSKSKGTPYDRAILLEKKITDKAIEIINDKKIDIVISNGPPHRIMYYTIKLKNLFPSIKFISDLRDPWTWWYNYGYPFLSEENMKEEKRMEAEVILKSDLITVTYPEMKEQVLEQYANANVFVLPHGYDPDDFVEKFSKERKSTLNLVYFGSLYNNEEMRMHQLANAINKNEKVHLDIYSNEMNYFSIFSNSGCSSRVNYYQPVASKKLFSNLSNYDAFIMVLPDKFCNNFSSKFYEVLKSGLPFILITKEGDLTAFLEKNKLGFSITNNVEQSLNDLFKNWEVKEISTSFNIEDYSINHLSKKLIETILNTSLQ